MKTNAHYVIKHPIITEETQIQSSKGPQYTFRVDPKANKQEIRVAVEELFPDDVRAAYMAEEARHGRAPAAYLNQEKNQ